MALMKGGGGNLLREKITEHIALRLVILVGEEKVVPRLGTNFPVFLEVIEFGRAMVHSALEGMGATVTQRMNGDVSAALLLLFNLGTYRRVGSNCSCQSDAGQRELTTVVLVFCRSLS